jgi:hypothetical protein
MDHPLPWLRYVSAGDLDDSSVSFDGMKVESVSSENLGKVDGFIVDASSGRPYHVVVDAGGWFKSRLFLLPIGHIGLSGSADGKRRLVANIDKEHIDRYPGFDRGEFEKLTDADLERMNREMASSCCPAEIVEVTVGPMFDSWSHYRAPSWWDADFYRPDRVDASSQSMAGSTPRK